MMRDYFEPRGFKISVADRAEDATDFLRDATDIDLVITDIDLPGMSGIELLQLIKETHPGLPVVLITGFRDLQFAISAIKHGAHDYITKPFQLAHVKTVVDKVIRYRRSSQKREQIVRFAESIRMDFSFPTHEIDPGIVASYLSKLLMNSGFCNEEEQHGLYLAFIETIINSVEHGNLELRSKDKGDDFENLLAFESLRDERLADPKYGNREIKIDFQFSPQNFLLTIIDEGPGFDWKKYVNEKHEVSQPSTLTHGRGFTFISYYVDEVYFSDRGNSITLVKSKSNSA